jgi:macrolide transport system ATP-binding/permease protein
MAFQCRVTNISKTYGIHQILNQVSLTLSSGQRLGLVGANGVGKSTLIKIITGEIDADEGTISFTPGLQIGYLQQTITDIEGKTLADLIAESLSQLRAIESRLRVLEQQMTSVDGATLDDVMAEYGDLTEQFERYGGYEMDSRVDTVLGGLKIAKIARERPFSTLSGGEKARFGLAMLLLQSPDLLLLDEPTNHLDAASLTWLEDYLRATHGAILVVSHDRHFLNRVVNVIVEINEHTHQTKRYAGDYDAYRLAKQQERVKWHDDFARQQDEIKRLRQEIKVTARRNDNYRAKYAFSDDKLLRNFKKAGHDTTISKRVRNAEEKLKRIDANPVPRPPDELRFDPDFDPQVLRGRVPVHVEDLKKSFGENIILRDVSFSLRLKSRVLLVGPNGAGKSTLLKILVGLETPTSGEVYLHPAARIGYLDQEQRTLNPDHTVFEAYRGGLEEPDQTLKSMLLRAELFRYDELDKRVGDLSVGQQRKLQIARMIAAKANLLILDEPTNYVSFDVLEEFETTLREFPGPIIAASHDRRFIQQFNGDIWRLEDGQLIEETQGDTG